ncbi:hypothetical protein [Olsenella urininfantis]|uniref:hypothetical protein n=1 Tax=Olsenella urininfantis TaxID=1871033 RepID=UPI00117C4225|nr:hypothetical protein [Olsenella urininfantis]
MERDSLVHVAATGGYGSVFGETDGVCEVGLLDPLADDYSLRVPSSQLTLLEDALPDGLPGLLEGLSLFHLRVGRGLDVDASFELFLGRDEEGLYGLWFSRGLERARQLASVSWEGLSGFRSCVGALDLGAWHDGGPSCGGCSLDAWGWSLELAGAGLGASAFGREAAPGGLRELCRVLARLGAPISWGEAGPVASDGA